jgi:hypothetical protein
MLHLSFWKLTEEDFLVIAQMLSFRRRTSVQETHDGSIADWKTFTKRCFINSYPLLNQSSSNLSKFFPLRDLGVSN